MTSTLGPNPVTALNPAGSGLGGSGLGRSARGGPDRVNNFCLVGAVTDAILNRNGAADAFYIADLAFSGLAETGVRYPGNGQFQIDPNGDGLSNFALPLSVHWTRWNWTRAVSCPQAEARCPNWHLVDRVAGC